MTVVWWVGNGVSICFICMESVEEKNDADGA